jgi:DNA-binding CsgD family transcriptional regulator
MLGGQLSEWERQMKANLQSSLMSLDIDTASGMYGNTSHVIYPIWTKMPDYVLEYVVERGRASSGINFQSSPLASTATDPIVSKMTSGAPSPQAIEAVLTPRQHDVFKLIVQGMSNKEIARNLRLAEGTVKIHIKALFKKLGVRRRAAVAVAGTRLSSPQRGNV